MMDNENDKLLGQFEKKFEHEGASQKIEISLDKNKYYALHRRVDEDGEIYPVRVNPAPAVKRRYRLKRSVEALNADLSGFNAIHAECFEKSLLLGEKIYWFENAKYSLLSCVIVGAIFCLIFTSMAYYCFFSSILPSFAAALIPAVLIGLGIRCSGRKYYAVTNLRVLISDNDEFREIPIERILSVQINRYTNNHADVIIKIKDDTVLITNIMTTEELVELLSRLNINVKGTVNEV